MTGSELCKCSFMHDQYNNQSFNTYIVTSEFDDGREMTPPTLSLGQYYRCWLSKSGLYAVTFVRL